MLIFKKLTNIFWLFPYSQALYTVEKANGEYDVLAEDEDDLENYEQGRKIKTWSIIFMVFK